MSAHDCASIEPLLAARAVGTLPYKLADRLEEHILSCAACLEMAKQLESSDVADLLLEVGGMAEADFQDLVVVPESNYVRGKEIGRGGMGRIVRARDRRLGRAVAIKELLDESLRGRFEREARLTARLSHPAIVNVHEAGRWPSGEPFYAMNYVAGRQLDKVIAERTTLSERLSLLPNFIGVVEAIAYAHSERVIHRDLKPHNLLLGSFGEMVVVDWGLAKDLDLPDDELPGGDPYRTPAGPDLTYAGAGTPHYMAPEQAAGGEPSERFDVYGLGATLYHLLAGRPPFADLAVGELTEARRRGAARCDVIEPQVPRELADIVAKAMAHIPGERYTGASELADELRRFETGQLVGAHHYTTPELVRRWLHRHRVVMVLSGMFLSVLVATAIVAVRRVVRARDEAVRTSGELLLERGSREVLSGAPDKGLVYLDRALELGVDGPHVRFLVGEAERRAGRLLAAYPLANASSVSISHSVRFVAAMVDGGNQAVLVNLLTGAHEVEITRDDRWGVATAVHSGQLLTWGCPLEAQIELFEHPERAAMASCGRALEVHSAREASRSLIQMGHLSLVEVSTDGTHVLGLTEYDAFLWDLRQPTVMPRLLDRPGERPGAAGLAPDGERVALVLGDDISIVTAKGVIERTLPGAVKQLGGIDHLSFSRSGRKLAAVSFETAQVAVWDLDDGRLIASFTTPHRTPELAGSISVSWSAGDAWLLTSGVTGDPQLWRGDTFARGPALVMAIPAKLAHFDASGGVALTADDAGNVRVWDLSGQELVHVSLGNGAQALAIDVTMEGRLVTVDQDGVRLWEARPSLVATFPPHPSAYESPGFLPDGRLLTVSDDDGTAVLSDRHGRVETALPAPGPWQPGQRRRTVFHEGAVVVVELDGSVTTWDATLGWDQRRKVPSIAPPITAAGRRLAYREDDGWTVRDVDGRLVARWHEESPDEHAVVSPDDRLLAENFHASNRIRVWSMETGHLVGSYEARTIWEPEFAPDGQSLAWNEGKRLVLGGVPDSSPAEYEAPEHLRAFRFSPDGARLLAITRSGALASFQVGQPGRTTIHDLHMTENGAWAISRDGTRVAVGGDDGTVSIWDIEQGAQLSRMAFQGRVRRLELSPDGGTLWVADAQSSWLVDVRGDERPAMAIHAQVAVQKRWSLRSGALVPSPLALSIFPPPASLAPRPALACPPGTIVRGAPWPAGHAAWCVRAGGTLHGPLIVWRANGSEAVNQMWEEGVRKE